MRQIRDHHTEIPIVVVTGYADTEIAIRALNKGARVKITEGYPGELCLDSTSIAGETTSEDIPIREVQVVTIAVAESRVY